MNIEDIKKEIEKDLNDVKDLKSLNELHIKYLSKKGIITEFNSKIKDVPNDKKKEFGMGVNFLRTYFNEGYNAIKEKLESEELNKKLENESIDISLPSTKVPIGTPNILEKLIEEVEEIFMSMGYDVVDGPEVEEDKYNFEMLNIPKGHPARDAQDTFYIEGEEILLRSQTSPVQVRTMLKAEGKRPVRVICPGKTYRRDDDDATHSPMFTQMEGLVVDKTITLCDLKGMLEVLVQKIFGEGTTTRLRPSYFPFTEPSVEVDVSCFACGGCGCRLCKGTGWIEVLGAGIVNKKGLENCGIDSEEYSGLAFGIGIERLAMLKYGINNIKLLYQSDMRVLDQINDD